MNFSMSLYDMVRVEMQLADDRANRRHRFEPEPTRRRRRPRRRRLDR
jgi:hypothetical protein